jgi:hypothetical protein
LAVTALLADLIPVIRFKTGDTEVERRLNHKARGEMEAVRATLEWVRGAMCEGIQKM